jgi:hypothetical protein
MTRIEAITYTEGVDGNTSIGFTARAVTIDNYSQSWIYIQGGQKYVRPWAYGCVVPISGMDQGQVQWRTPGSLPVPPPTVPIGFVNTHWTDADLPGSEGTLLFQAQNQSIVIDTSVGTGVNVTHVVQVPAGTQALGVMLSSGSVVPNAIVQLTGVQSGFQYYVGNPMASAVVMPLPSSGVIDQAFDNPVPLNPLDQTVTFLVRAAVGTTAQLVAFPYSPAPQIVQVVNTMAPSNITGAVAPLIVSPSGASTITPVTQGYLPVLQRPTFNLLVTRVNVIVAGGILIAAPGVGQSIVLRKVLVTLSAAAAAVAVISMGTTLTGADLAQWGLPIGAAATPDIDQLPWTWDDYLVGDNKPVDISSNVATFTNTSVMITYSVVTTAQWPAG